MLEVQILVVLFVLHSQSQTQGAQPKSDAATNSVDSPCTEARYHHQLARKMQNALDSAAGELSKYAKLPTAYRIAVAHTSSAETRMTLTALAIHADITATAALKELEGSRASYKRSATLLNARVARLRQLHALTPNKATAKNTQKKDAQSLFGAWAFHTYEAEIELTAKDNGNCLLENAKIGAITAANIDLAATTQIKMLAEAKIKFRDYILKAGSKGSIGSVDTASTTHHGLCAERGQHNSPSAATNVIAGELAVGELDQAPADVPYF
uniref:Variant surface glycoprotein 1867 n=1 Tax=Trypanosoma brucei TaxID=5691 RepID=M4SXJ4_9TRYP|nr:variant surface glycoprotein 1867 [Trypanosoma brucei]